MLKFVGLFLVVLAQSFSSYAVDDHPRRGIEHVDSEAYRYGFWYKFGDRWAFGYGYHLDSAKDGGTWEALRHDQCPRNQTDGRTLTADIKDAILDNDRFMLALDEKRFGEAWHMGLPNEQGDIWRKRAEINAKSEVTKLVKQSVVENDSLKLNQAIAIKNQFNGLPVYGDLETLITETRRSAEHLLGQYNEGEGAAEAETRALRNLALRVIGE